MKLIFLIIDIIDILTIYLCGLFIQEMSNKNIVYGVRVPVGEEKSQAIKNFIRKYKKNYSLSMLLALAIHLVIFSFNEKLQAFQLVLFLYICIFIMFFNYYAVNKQLKAYKKQAGWKFESNKLVVVDTKYRKKDAKEGKTVLSDWWYLIPLSMVVINIILLAVNYNSIPEKIAAHMNYRGDIDSWKNKSFLTVYMMPIMAFILNFAMLLSNKFIRNAKQDLNGGNISQVKFNSRRERYYQSLILYITSIALNVVFFIISLQMVSIVKLSSIAFIVILLLSFVPVIFTVFAAMEARKEKPIEEKEEGTITIDRDDDDNYIMGMIYYNAKDPATFVEKRAGLGVTFNYAKKGAVIFTVVMCIILVGTLVLLLFAK